MTEFVAGRKPGSHRAVSCRLEPPYSCLSGMKLPGCFAEMRKPPEQVHLWGAFPPGPYVSIVGTRRATPSGVRAVERLASELAQQGVTVLSGGALGIDSAAHRGAMEAGGVTLVVAPLHWKTAYPSENHTLFDEVIEGGGGYLCLSTPEARPLNPTFFLRNEALVALSDVVVLGECPLRSGAKNAMQHARRMGRARSVLPPTFSHETAFGAVQEVSEMGARLISSSRCVLRQLKETAPRDNPKWWDFLESERAESGSEKEASVRATRKVPPPTDPVAEAIWAGSQTVDAICELKGLSPQLVQHRILFLTLEGVVSEDDAGLLRYHSPSHERR